MATAFLFRRAQKVYQANPESFNGAIRDTYSWSQSITDTDVQIKVNEKSFFHLLGLKKKT